MFSAALSALGSGTHFAWPSPAFPKLLSGEMGFSVSEEQASYIAMVGPMAYLVAGPMTAWMVDKIGRKPTILFLAVPQIAAWLLIANATSVYTLYIAKFTAGIAEGSLFTCLPMYIGEVSEPRIRGLLGSCHSILIIFGLVLVNAYGSYMSIRDAAYWSIAIPVAFLVTFVWMPESPYYYLMKDDEESARESLKILRRMHNVDPELSRLSSDIKRQLSEPGSIKDVFTISTNRKAFLILLGLRTFQQFSGVSAFGFYTQFIFQQSGSNLSPAVSAIIYSAAQFAITLFGSILVDKFGRKPLLLFSCLGTALTLFAESAFFYVKSLGYDVTPFLWMPLTVMMTYIIVFSIGFGVCPNLMMGELLSATVKGKALSIINIAFALGISSSSKIFQGLGTFGLHVPFFLFGMCCLVATFFSYYFVPETKGKTLEEIQQTLRGEKKEVVERKESKEIYITRL